MTREKSRRIPADGEQFGNPFSGERGKRDIGGFGEERRGQARHKRSNGSPKGPDRGLERVPAGPITKFDEI
jgi:hypothetical protein